MPNLKPVWKGVLDTQRQRLGRLADRRGTAPLKRLYDDSHDLALKKLRAAMRSMGGETFTAHHLRFVMAQLQQGQALLAKRMAGELGDLTREAQREAVRGVAHDIARLEGAFRGATVELPLEEAATFRGIIANRAPSLMSRHATSIARYTADGVTGMEGVLGTTLLTGGSPMDALGALEEFAGNDWWRAERIVRTEASYAFNMTRRDSIEEAASELPDLMMRWTEHCSDELVALDDRVSVDSLAMHGQVAAPGGMFFCPDESPVPEVSRYRKQPVSDVPGHLAGEEFEGPPNRPNDRAVLLPWRPGWDIPAWRWSGGRRVPAEGSSRANRAIPEVYADDLTGQALPFREDEKSRKRREGHGDVLVEVDSEEFATKWRGQNRGAIEGVGEAGRLEGTGLAWHPTRWENSQAFTELRRAPEVAVGDGGTLSVTDGRHRLAAAAQKGGKVVVAVPPADIAKLKKQLEHLRRVLL